MGNRRLSQQPISSDPPMVGNNTGGLMNKRCGVQVVFNKGSRPCRSCDCPDGDGGFQDIHTLQQRSSNNLGDGKGMINMRCTGILHLLQSLLRACFCHYVSLSTHTVAFIMATINFLVSDLMRLCDSCFIQIMWFLMLCTMGVTGNQTPLMSLLPVRRPGNSSGGTGVASIAAQLPPQPVS